MPQLLGMLRQEDGNIKAFLHCRLRLRSACKSLAKYVSKEKKGRGTGNVYLVFLMDKYVDLGILTSE